MLDEILSLVGRVISAALEFILTLLIETVLLIYDLVYYLWFRRKRERKAQDGSEDVMHTSTEPPQFEWRANQQGFSITKIVFCLLILSFITLVGINFLYLEPLVRAKLDKIERQQHIIVEYDEFSGNLFTGNYSFGNLRVQRNNSAINYRLQLKELNCKAYLWNIIGSPIKIDYLQLNQIQGNMRFDLQYKSQSKNKKIIEIKDFSANGITLVLQINSDYNLPLEINTLEYSPLRTDVPIIDTLFHANIQAKLGGQNIRITHEAKNHEWQFEGVPAAILRETIATKPFTWFSEGKVTLNMKISKPNKDQAKVAFKLDTKGLAISKAKGDGFKDLLTFGLFAKYLAKKNGDLSLAFDANMAPDKLEINSSKELKAFWKEIGKSLLKHVLH